MSRFIMFFRAIFAQLVELCSHPASSANVVAPHSKHYLINVWWQSRVYKFWERQKVGKKGQYTVITQRYRPRVITIK